MTRWEYQSALHTVPATRDELNLIGDDGWELVSILQLARTNEILYVFKRPKQASPGGPDES